MALALGTSLIGLQQQDPCSIAETCCLNETKRIEETEDINPVN